MFKSVKDRDTLDQTQALSCNDVEEKAGKVSKTLWTSADCPHHCKHRAGFGGDTKEQASNNNRISCSAVEAVIFAPDEGGVKTIWESACGIDAGKAIGCAEPQTLVKLMELERLLELDYVSALVSLYVSSRDSRVSL
ncbi:hypothetical protein TNCV_4757891 [Trichonephila clavipes]|nr:hypothetical protein TNCV_4757891 [Trichonephila clavipes]